MWRTYSILWNLARSGMIALFVLALIGSWSRAWAEPVPGSMDVRWNEGAPHCAAAPSDPLQVHAYEPQTYILRHSNGARGAGAGTSSRPHRILR
jgi:hypothetical protein